MAKSEFLSKAQAKYLFKTANGDCLFLNWEGSIYFGYAKSHPSIKLHVREDFHFWCREWLLG
jgi:hypothetical protein